MTEVSSNKALIIATVPGFFTHMRTVRDALLSLGYDVEAASNYDIDSTVDFSTYSACHNICFSRSPFSLSNIRAFRQLLLLVRAGNYGLVFCNTPVGGVLGRLAANSRRRNGTKVVYMAHGFHFFKGSPRVNWLLYYPIEWSLSWITDLLITITKEDYERAKKLFHARKTVYVPGVGVDLERFSKAEASDIRDELGIPHESRIVLSVGELNHNKNQQIIVRALPELDENIHYIIAGKGNELDALQSLAAELGVKHRLHLLGNRDDVPRLMRASDVFVLPSLREGLNVSLMEAMASGLPCVCRRIRGNVDLACDENGAVLVDEESPEAWAKAICQAFALNRSIVRGTNQKTVLNFSCQAVNKALMSALYELQTLR